MFSSTLTMHTLQNRKYNPCHKNNSKMLNKSVVKNSTVHEGEKPFKCLHCDFSSSRKRNKDRHIALVHEGQKPFKCTMCENSFSEKSKMNKHILSVHDKFMIEKLRNQKKYV